MACKTNFQTTGSAEAVRVPDALTNAMARAYDQAARECIATDYTCTLAAEIKPGEIIVRYFSKTVQNPFVANNQKLTNHLIEVVYTGTYSCFKSKPEATGAALATACGGNFDIYVESTDAAHPLNAASADAEALVIATAICAKMPAGCTIPSKVNGSAVLPSGVWKSTWACTKPVPVGGGSKTAGGSSTAGGSGKKPKKSTTVKKPKKATGSAKSKKAMTSAKPKKATRSAKPKKATKPKKPLGRRRG